MLATVFYAQPIGQFLACIVAVITTASFQASISGTSGNASPTNCTGACLHATDKIWRWIVGFGAIPPAFAVLLRFWIPESPRYLLEVEGDPMGFEAADYPQDKYYATPLWDEERVVNVSNSWDPHQHITNTDPLNENTANQDPLDENIANRDPLDENITNSDPLDENITNSDPLNENTANADPLDENPLGHHPPSTDIPPSQNSAGMELRESRLAQSLQHTPEGTHNAASLNATAGSSTSAYTRSTAVDPLDERRSIENSPRTTPVAPSDLLFKTHKDVEVTIQQATPDNASAENAPVARTDLEPITSHGQNTRTNNARRNGITGKESWKEFRHGFSKYLFEDGNWTDLAGTASTWFLLDFGFYFLTVNSPKLISKVWETSSYSEVYPMLMQYSWRAIISTSVGAIIGGAIFIKMARHRWNLQFYGFITLAGLFVIIGIVYIKLLNTRYFAAIIVLYCAANLFFDFGPNTSTFVVSAILFKRKYTCKLTLHQLRADNRRSLPNEIPRNLRGPLRRCGQIRQHYHADLPLEAQNPRQRRQRPSFHLARMGADHVSSFPFPGHCLATIYAKASIPTFANNPLTDRASSCFSEPSSRRPGSRTRATSTGIVGAWRIWGRGSGKGRRWKGGRGRKGKRRSGQIAKEHTEYINEEKFNTSSHQTAI